MKEILIISEREIFGDGIEKVIDQVIEEKGLSENDFSIQRCFRNYKMHKERYSENLLCIIYTGLVRSRNEFGQSDLLLKYGEKEINEALEGNKVPLIYARGYFTGAFNHKIKAKKIKRKLSKLL